MAWAKAIGATDARGCRAIKVSWRRYESACCQVVGIHQPNFKHLNRIWQKLARLLCRRARREHSLKNRLFWMPFYENTGGTYLRLWVAIFSLSFLNDRKRTFIFNSINIRYLRLFFCPFPQRFGSVPQRTCKVAYTRLGREGTGLEPSLCSQLSRQEARCFAEEYTSASRAGAELEGSVLDSTYVPTH